ncbi:protein of unknown function (plasmid) [Paraburkholderia dioscoreae]|uniref:Uncharacterized protein n=1 Tax=Paraburkholderia dioscoreae TaxID=2604047 RepID=A0A5Q4YV03_9BURK|nr:protein of unknown function [Paraburkholderia dioscoreae]
MSKAAERSRRYSANDYRRDDNDEMRETSEAVNNDRIPAAASDLQPETAGLRVTVDAVARLTLTLP